jgi:nucleotide-binding universal stress UspA family protein
MLQDKKILAPTDFAPSSQVADDLALELAQRFHVPLVLLHVYQLPTTIGKGLPTLPISDYVRLIEDSAQSALNNEAARLSGKGVEVTTTLVSTVLKSGSAWEEILEAAKKLDAGLIVMGTHGRRGLPHALLGSVAEKVVRLSPIPVLTVRATEEG